MILPGMNSAAFEGVFLKAESESTWAPHNEAVAVLVGPMVTSVPRVHPRYVLESAERLNDPTMKISREQSKNCTRIKESISEIIYYPTNDFVEGSEHAERARIVLRDASNSISLLSN